MQKASLIVLFFVVTAFSSCSYYERQTKQLFYNQLSGTNDSLDKMTTEWHQLLNRAIVTKNFSGLAASRTKMGQFMSRNRAKVSNIELPPNTENLMDSEEVFLSGRANIISQAYPGFEAFNDVTPNGDIVAQMQVLSNDSETETSTNAAIRKSLQSFAKANGLKMQKGVK